MVAPTSIGPGWTVGPGWSIGTNTGPGPGPSGSNGVVGFSEMTATGNIVTWLQGGQPGNATITSTGFTITANTGNPPLTNGVAISSLTPNNQAFFASYGTGNHTATWAAGSTITGPTTVNVDTISGSQLIFYIGNVSTPATFNFPVTFS